MGDQKRGNHSPPSLPYHGRRMKSEGASGAQYRIWRRASRRNFKIGSNPILGFKQESLPSIGFEPMTFPMSRERATTAPTGRERRSYLIMSETSNQIRSFGDSQSIVNSLFTVFDLVFPWSICGGRKATACNSTSPASGLRSGRRA